MSKKPPKHPSGSLHLPVLLSPVSNPEKPRFTILHSPKLKSIESSRGITNTSLTPNNSMRSRGLFSGFHSARSRDSSESYLDLPKTDIEKIIIDQSYIYSAPIKKNVLSRSLDFSEGIKRQSRVYTEESNGNKSDREVEHSVKLPYITHDKQKDECVKRIIVPDIPKAKFGVHRPYHELNVREDFKVVEVQEDERESTIKPRVVRLEYDQKARHRILNEILTKRQD